MKIEIFNFGGTVLRDDKALDVRHGKAGTHTKVDQRYSTRAKGLPCPGPEPFDIGLMGSFGGTDQSCQPSFEG
jgi:hypothetical protein